MARDAEWVVGNLRKVAKRQAKRMPKRGKPVTPRAQFERFLSGAEFERVRRGEITPEDYAKYQQHWLKKLGI